MSAPTAGQGRTRTAAAALAGLLGDTPVALFAAQVWAVDLFARARSAGPDLTGLFSVSDADELLSVRGLRTPFLRVAKDGVVQPPASFTRGGGVGAGIKDQVDADLVTRALADGCTLVFQGLHRIWPPLVGFTAALTGELGHPVQVNAYLTPPSARGFAAHYDTHDVFVVQTAGAKRWTVHRPVLPEPAESDGWDGRRAQVQEAAAGEPAWQQVMAPGDVLYLPRGWIHSAQAQDEMSLHLTIGVHPYTRRHLADAVLAELFGNQPMQGSLPLGVDVADPRSVREHLPAVLAAITGGLAGVDADAVADRMSARWAADTRPFPVPPAAQVTAAAAAAAGQGVRLQPRPGVALRVRESVDEAVLLVDGRPVRFPPGHASALKAVVAAAAHGSEAELTADGLPGLDGDQAAGLAAALLLEGAALAGPDDTSP